jgi:hypothetical protein
MLCAFQLFLVQCFINCMFGTPCGVRRAKYIVGSVQQLLDKPEGGSAWLLGLRDRPYAEAHEALCSLPGGAAPADNTQQFNDHSGSTGPASLLSGFHSQHSRLLMPQDHTN